MPFSYDRAWQDVTAMFRADWMLLLTLAGAFLFFPAFVLFVFAPMPEGQAGVSTQAAFEQIIAYYETNILWFLLVNAIGAFAQASILALLLDQGRPTVREALVGAGRLLPSFFIAQVITNFATGAALALLIVPGIYLLGRFAVVGPLLIERSFSNPLRAIADGWRATERRGWRIAGLILLVVVVVWVVTSAIASALTIFGALIVADSARPLVGGFTGALSSAVLSLLMVVLSAAIYRQLAGSCLGDIFT